MKPSISIVIPTLSDAPPDLLKSLWSQTMVPDEIEVVRGVRPNGRARNIGVSRTRGDFLVFIDDDARPTDTTLLEKLLLPLTSDLTIGATGTSRLIPPESSFFQRRAAREVARIENPLVHEPVKARPCAGNYFYSPITTTCCALRRKLFVEVGGFDEELIQGVDSEFFVRLARAGYDLLLVPELYVYHPAPPNLPALLRKHFHYGRGHAQQVIRDPLRARIFEHRPLLYILLRTALVLPHVFLPFTYADPKWRPGFKPLRALASYASALGYAVEQMRAKRKQEPS